MDFLCFFRQVLYFTLLFHTSFIENKVFFLLFQQGKLISHFNTSNELKLVILIQKLLSGIISKKILWAILLHPSIVHWLLNFAKKKSFSQKLLSIVLWISNGLYTILAISCKAWGYSRESERDRESKLLFFIEIWIAITCWMTTVFVCLLKV